jgi:hypothetical protein
VGFLFVDRIVDVEGALVVEAFAQASQLLIAASPDFAQVGRGRDE